MTKGIIFDFGGVFNNTHEATDGFTRAAARFGYNADELYAVLYSGPDWNAAKVGRITGAEYWRRMMAAIDRETGDVDAFKAVLFEGERIDPLVVSIAERLAQRLPLALLSNATDELEALLDERWRLRYLFRVVVNSAVAGVAKPESRAYWLALEGLGIEPSEALFIDDKPRNVAAAEALGIPSLVFSDAERLERDLRARMLLP